MQASFSSRQSNFPSFHSLALVHDLHELMSFPQPKFSTPSSTFSSPRTAPRPKVIPLYKTPIPRRATRPLPIHRTLPERALYHPYAHARRERPHPIIIEPSATSSNSTTPEVPGSPLTPIDQHSAPLRANVVLTPPPREGELRVNNVGWHRTQQEAWRKIAKNAIIKHKLDVKKCLSEQVPSAREQAVKEVPYLAILCIPPPVNRPYSSQIEDAVPSLKNQQDHWGPVLLLRETLKNQKDTRVKAEKRSKGKEPETV
ncbi:hypothetical protein E1B28_007550 [Marasmius oreades]|uniref:Uncharacterized protein n=1 Tax=Marasmius oreades TaxID=181124 RepID=A0A9P7S1X8_9AGAR|nr:uncharacterized protein E1B28_007550 [Marasmius oreades]KAG7093914.1 hypothetical protein E1B28_007550 [Marasmius oreades]